MNIDPDNPEDILQAQQAYQLAFGEKLSPDQIKAKLREWDDPDAQDWIEQEPAGRLCLHNLRYLSKLLQSAIEAAGLSISASGVTFHSLTNRPLKRVPYVDFNFQTKDGHSVWVEISDCTDYRFK